MNRVFSCFFNISRYRVSLLTTTVYKLIAAKIVNVTAFITTAALVALSSTSIAIASAYIGTQDKQLHYDLQTLVEWGYLDVAVSTYPVPWKGVSYQLDKLSPQGMAFRPRQALMRLNHYLSLNKQQQSRHFLTLQGASDDIRFRSFDDGVENKGKATFATEFYAGRWSGQISANYESGGSRHLDNSYIAYQFGDWNLRLGSIEQWWGPAQSSSLIMSNNTRPIKALALSRSVNTQSKSPWLKWMGPWYFTTQMGQLEKSRTTSDAKIIMTRFNNRPFKGFEFGVSWTVMWGGEGQPEDLSTLLEVVTFQGICQAADGDCSIIGETKQGNHMAGFDISYTTRFLDRPFTFYAQRVGEDAVNGYKITDNANLFGLSTYWRGAKVFIETSDTNVACDGDSIITNCYYENSAYPDGYRMYGRTFGSTFDSDAKQVTIGANMRLENGDMFELYLRNAQLNPDGTRPSPALTKDVTEDLLEVSGFYQKPVGNWLLKAGGTVSNRQYSNIEDEVDALIYVKAQLAF